MVDAKCRRWRARVADRLWDDSYDEQVLRHLQYDSVRSKTCLYPIIPDRASTILNPARDFAYTSNQSFFDDQGYDKGVAQLLFDQIKSTPEADEVLSCH